MKRITFLVTALALVLGLTQCKKDQEKPQGETVNITLEVKGGGSGAKVDVNPNGSPMVTFESGDQILVGYDGKYVGTLTHNGTQFTGTIEVTQNGDQPLYFYFVGNKNKSGASISVGDATYSVDISDQSTELPVLSMAPSDQNFSTEVASYTASLHNQCALVELTLTSGTTDAVGLGDRYTQATINFGGTPGIVPNTETMGMIKMKPSGDNTKKYAILLPQAAVDESNIAIGHVGYTLDVPAMSNNNYIKFNNEGAVESNIVYLNYLTTHYTAYNGKTLTGTLAGNYIISIAPGATVTLDGVTINGVNNISYPWAGINCVGTATIILKDGTTNTVRGFYEWYPGIHIPGSYTLTIKGTGTLNASGSYGAGIGGGYTVDCGNIEIQGGTINATCGGTAAAIGGGRSASCGNITISGGNVTATSASGAGIGSGYAYDPTECGNISITGGTVIATGGNCCAGIGSGCNSSCGSITITCGVTSVTATKGKDAYNSIGKGWGNEAVTCGTVTIGGVVYWNGSSYQNGGDTYLPTSPLVYPTPAPSVTDLATITENYTASDGEILTGTLGANVKISIAAGATVTLDNADINGDATWKTGNYAGLSCLGDATIILSGTNTVKGFYENYPGIQAAHNTGSGDEYTLTIQGTGSLTASSNGWGAGIGGGYQIPCGNIVINGGSSIEATGGHAAGIGGGQSANCGNITISGGNITANGGESGAGIGTGNNGTCGNITISGGSITANGGSYAAGIGTGFAGNCGSITIYNTVTSVRASKGTDATNSIGTGYGESCGTVTIGGDEGSISTSPYIYAPLTWGSGFISSISLNGSGNVSQGGIKASLSGIADKDKFTSSNIDLESGTLTFEIESGGAYASYSLKKIEIYYDGPLGSISGTPSDGWSVNTSEKIVTWSGTSTTVSLRSANPASEWLFIGDIPHIVFHLHK